MKKRTLALLIILVFALGLLSACSVGADKIVGRWTTSDGSSMSILFHEPYAETDSQGNAMVSMGSSSISYMYGFDEETGKIKLWVPNQSGSALRLELTLIENDDDTYLLFGSAVKLYKE